MLATETWSFSAQNGISLFQVLIFLFSNETSQTLSRTSDAFSELLTFQ